MKLIKLSSEHYIIVDDSEVKIDDLYLDDTNTVRFAITETKSYWAHRKGYKKITHSTRPLEPYTYDEVGEEIYGHMYDNIQRLSLSEVKELLGEVDVDVEKKADEFCDRYFTEKGKLISVAYKSGYNQALEDNKSNVYTEKDIRSIIMQIRGDLVKHNYNHYSINYDSIIQSFQHPTSWDVTFINGKLKIK